MLPDRVRHRQAQRVHRHRRPLPDAQWLALLLFVVEVYLLTAISGLTVGKRLLGLRTIRTNGDRPGFKWAAVRTVLLLFVVPACLTDRDQRGLHDRAADTIVVRLLLAFACWLD